MSDSGLFKKIRDFYDKYIDNKFVRFLLLIGAGGFGLLFGKFADVQFFYGCLGLHETVAEYLATAVVGVFVFILLWYFRTRDVRQQIEKTQAQIDKFQIQIQQNYFNNAIENLTSDSILKEEIGIKSLIKFSETTPEFSELIKIAFESSINEFQRSINIYGHIYSSTPEPKYSLRKDLIKDMQKWLYDHPEPKKE